MSIDEFLNEMVEVLQTEEKITLNTVLSNLAEWDSLSIMATMAFLKKNFNVKVTMQDLNEMKTIGDIASKAGL